MVEDRIRVLVLPADTDQPCVVKFVENSMEGFQEEVGGWFEVISSDAMNVNIPLRLGVMTVMVVNEDGKLGAGQEGMEENIRARLFYPREPLFGTVFICGEQRTGDYNYESLPVESLEGILQQLPVDRRDEV